MGKDIARSFASVMNQPVLLVQRWIQMRDALRMSGYSDYCLLKATQRSLFRKIRLLNQLGSVTPRASVVPSVLPGETM